jgi:hypothetical protein
MSGLASKAAPPKLALCRWHYALFASLPHDTGNGFAGLSTVLYPIIRTIQFDLVVLTGFSRIVVTNHFKEFAIPRSSFVRYHYAIKRAILRAFSP